jgi:FKBP-type peptidyl-prolyl cis-trans isomerase 2
MAQAESGNTVKVHYTGRLEDGTEFDSSKGKEPLEFTIGQGQLIPGFEQGVLGMGPGESKTINIPSDQAYGPHDPEKVIEMDRDQVPPGVEPQIGMQIRGTPPGGRPIVFTVSGVSESKVTLDGNHPLAGKDLVFEIQLVEIV